MIQVVKGCFL